MEITTSHSKNIAKTNTKGVRPRDLRAKGQSTSLARDILALGVGAGAAVTGGIYGLGEGLVKNGIQNYPKHLSTGAKIGRAIATPVGGALGAIATASTVAVAAIGAPVVSGLAVGLGLVGGTAVSAAKHLPSSIIQTGKNGAAAGANAGRGLGAVGAVVGATVGGALGGVAGVAVALVKGVPTGLKVAKREAHAGLNLMKSVPQIAKGTWNIAYHGGRAVAGALGAGSGGAAGALTATGETAIEGLANSVARGAQWGKISSDYVRGEST